MDVATDVAPLTEVDASAPTVAHPTSTNVISEGDGGHAFNDDGAPLCQDCGEPDANDAHTRRDLTQEQQYSLMQKLLQKSIGDRVGQGFFQEILKQFN